MGFFGFFTVVVRGGFYFDLLAHSVGRIIFQEVRLEAFASDSSELIIMFGSFRGA